jgi:hypothetical protein
MAVDQDRADQADHRSQALGVRQTVGAGPQVTHAGVGHAWGVGLVVAMRDCLRAGGASHPDLQKAAAVAHQTAVHRLVETSCAVVTAGRPEERTSAQARRSLTRARVRGLAGCSGKFGRGPWNRLGTLTQLDSVTRPARVAEDTAHVGPQETLRVSLG